MKRFRDIIQDIKAPSTSDLWIDNGELKYYTSNGWKAIAGNGSSDVYTLPGTLQREVEWSTTDVESIVGNWDEFIDAVNNKVIVAKLENGDTDVNLYGIGIIIPDSGILLSISDFVTIYNYYITAESIVSIDGSQYIFTKDVINNLNTNSDFYPLSARQGKILNDRVTKLESKSNVAVLTPTGTKLMELVSSSPNVTQEQLVEAGFTPEICRRLNAGEVTYMGGECASFSNEALYPIQGITLNSSPDLVPPYLCYCYYSGYKGEGTASSGCFITIKENSPGKYLVDYIEV